MENLTVEVIDIDDFELWVTASGTSPLPDFPTIRATAQARTGRSDISDLILDYSSTWPAPGEPWEETWAVARKETA